MPTNDVENYQGTGTPTYIGDGWDLYIGAFNDSTSTATTAGQVWEVVFSNSTNAAVYPWLKQPATQATAMHVIGIVNNFKMSQSTGSIAASAWGLAQTRGYCPAVLGAASTTTEHTLTSTNTANTATDTGGATQAANTFGIAKSSNAVSPYSVAAWLFGNLVAMP